jgi:hypothetical protein
LNGWLHCTGGGGATRGMSPKYCCTSGFTCAGSKSPATTSVALLGA